MNTLTVEVKSQLVVEITKFVKETIIDLMMKSQHINTRNNISTNNQSRLYDELQKNKYNFEKAIPIVVKQLVNSGKFATYIHQICAKEKYFRKLNEIEDTEGGTYYDDTAEEEYEEIVTEFYNYSIDFMGLHLIANIQVDDDIIPDFTKEHFLQEVTFIVVSLMVEI